MGFTYTLNNKSVAICGVKNVASMGVIKQSQYLFYEAQQNILLVNLKCGVFLLFFSGVIQTFCTSANFRSFCLLGWRRGILQV